MNIVISQPMYFPWIGLLEQIRLADVYVDYGDVSFSKGSFVNRVQVKSDRGPVWMTVPLENVRLGQSINETRINNAVPWKRKHYSLLQQAYARAPYKTDMLALVDAVFSDHFETIGELSASSTRAACRFFELEDSCRFVDVESLDIRGSASQRVLDVVKALNGNTYITGHGAQHYLDHELFERAGIRVEYMRYRKNPYPQLHDSFTPYVSALDAIANLGKDGRNLINSGTTYWKEFLHHE